MRKIEKQIEEYLDWCENVRGLSKDTVLTYRQVLRILSSEVKVDRIEKVTNEMINSYIKERPWKPTSFNNHIICLKTAFKWFIKHSVKVKVDLDMLECAKLPKLKQTFYTKEEIENVLEYCDGLDWLLIRMAFECGFRIGEISRLKTSDIRGNKITFTGKGNKPRVVYVSGELKEALEDWLDQHPDWEYLWMRTYKREFKEYSAKGLTARMKKRFFALGYTDFHPHTLRHSFATHILKVGAPVNVVKDMMGHENIQTTMRYIHQLDGQLEGEFARYGAY